MTTRLSLEKARGYSGRKSGRSYVAQITGTDSQYGLHREFLDRSDVDWNDLHPGKPRGTWTEYFDLGPGLYEIQEYGERRYRLVYVGRLKSEAPDVPEHAILLAVEYPRVLAMAQLLNDNQITIDQARRATRPQTV